MGDRAGTPSPFPQVAFQPPYAHARGRYRLHTDSRTLTAAPANGAATTTIIPISENGLLRNKPLSGSRETLVRNSQPSGRGVGGEGKRHHPPLPPEFLEFA